MWHELAQSLPTIVAALVLAILGGIVRLALIVRDTGRDTKELAHGVAELRKDWADDHDRLAAVEAALWPGPPRGGRHRYGRAERYE